MKKRKHFILYLSGSILFIVVLLLVSLFFFSKFVSAEGAGDIAEDFSKYFSSVEVGKPDPENPNAAPIPFEGEVVARDANVKVKFTYSIDNNVQSNKTYDFDLPVEFDIETLQFSIVATKTETDGTETEVSVANVEIIGTKGSITFVDTTITEGWFYITAGLDASKITNATKELVFFPGQGGERKINLNFAAVQISAQATVTEHEVEIDTTANKVTWSFQVNPQLEQATAGIPDEKKLSQYYISVSIDEKLILLPETLTVTTSGATVDYISSGSEKQLKLELSEHDYKEGEFYTITYATTYDLDVFQETSIASFQNKTNFSFVYPQYADVSKGLQGVTSLHNSGNIASSQESQKTAEVTASYLEKDFSQTAIDEITWKVTVNQAKTSFASCSDVRDHLPEGLALKADSIVVSVNGTTVSNPIVTYTSKNNTDPYQGGDLVVSSLKTGVMYEITYTTLVDPVIWQTKPTATFENEVFYEVEYNGKGYGFSRKKSGTARFGGGESGGLIAGSGKYDRTNHMITWNIKVNDMKHTLTDGNVFIQIPEGLTYVSAAFDTALQGGNIQVEEGDKVIKVSLPASLSQEGVITLETTVDDENLWATNQGATNLSGASSITVRLSNKMGIDLSVNPSVTINTQVVDKSFVSYDYNTKTITWKVAVNQNGMAMKNPVLTDVLISGLIYVSGSVKSLENDLVKSATYIGNTIIIELKDFEKQAADYGTNAPSFTFETKIEDENLLKPAQGDATSPSADIGNTIQIEFDEIKDKEITASLSDSASSRVGSRPLSKKGTSNPSWRLYTWEVGINPNQISFPAGLTIVDDLPAGLRMDLESIKLYHAAVDAKTGKLTKQSEVSDLEYTRLLTLAPTGQHFELTFQNAIKDAYLLEFETDNLTVVGTSYNNKIYFKGETGSESSSGSVSQAAAGGGGTENPKRGSIQLKALEGNRPLAGVRYILQGTDQNNRYEFTTDEKGIAFFNPIKLDTYTVSVQMPSGYGALSTPTSFVLTSANKNPKQELQYTQSTDLVSLDYHANTADATVTGNPYPTQNYVSGAAVTILPNPYSRNGYLFAGWNTKADGSGSDYKAGDSLTLAENTILYAKWRAASGTLTVFAKKEDTQPVSFSNLEFSITTANGMVTHKATTNVSGEAVFSDIGIGSYTFLPPLPRPKGYIVKGTPSIPELVSDGASVHAYVIYETGYSLQYFGNTNTGGAVPPILYYPSNTQVFVRNNSFLKSGYHFTEWNTKADGSGLVYTEASSFKITEDMILYAIWEKDQAEENKPGEDDSNQNNGNPGIDQEKPGENRPEDLKPNTPSTGNKPEKNEPLISDDKSSLEAEKPEENKPTEEDGEPEQEEFFDDMSEEDLPVDNPQAENQEDADQEDIEQEEKEEDTLYPEEVFLTDSLPLGWKKELSVDVSDILAIPLAPGKGGLILSSFSDHKNAVSNVTFRIIRNQKTIVQKTDKRGIAVFFDIEPGEYEVELLETPRGYTFETNRTMKMNITHSQYSMAEATLSLSEYTPKTGDEFPLELIWGLTVLAFLVGTGSGYRIYQQQKRNKKIFSQK